MALYYDAASVLSSKQDQGSLKSRIYGASTLKSSPAQLYALISETAKRDVFLKEVLDNTQLLEHEPKLTPLLALLLCHDHFFSKGGVSAAIKHPLRQAIERHKARLQAEFTRARLRRKCASTDALKSALDRERAKHIQPHPRWARVNTLIAQDVRSTAESISICKRKQHLEGVLDISDVSGSYCYDEHLPNLLAFSPAVDLTRTHAYKNGELILQDKASCFPAYLLLGKDTTEGVGDVMDGCAAPGNKTTHLAAILEEIGSSGKVLACERDSTRSRTLQTMVAKAKATKVEVLAKQDFLALDPHHKRFGNVTHLLLDPSCSGSGILRREDIPKLALPNCSRTSSKIVVDERLSRTSQKRKRGETDDAEKQAVPVVTKDDAAQDDEEEVPVPVTVERLQKLSNLQTRIVEHAMKFPAARRITYSTCSIHEQENEVVVSRLLASMVAQTRGWKVLPRSSQIDGLKKWKHRGVRSKPDEYLDDNKLSEEELDACIRCSPDDEEGTMGFFVCAFVRHEKPVEGPKNGIETVALPGDDDVDSEEDSWDGFD